MYIALPGGVSVVKNAGGSQWQFSDHHGTATIGVDGATGAVEHRYSDPYGNPRGAAPQTWLGQKGFVGGSLNDSTGYTTMGARQYDPLLGRFLSVDPIIDVSDPTQINPYLYAKNNPATLSDASGLFPCYADHAAGNYCPGKPFDQDGADEQAAREEEEEKALEDAGINQSDIDDAWDVMNTDIVDIIIDVGAEILLDMIGVNDIKSCVGDGDIWACVSLALDVIPITKVFSVGKKLYKAGKKILSAVTSFNQKLEKAKGLLNRVGDAMKTASDRARKRIADMRSSRADAADSAAGKCNSFTSDAKVVMADGTTRPIADVAIGDEVLSTDPVTGETNAQLVTDLPRTGTADNEQARDLVTVTIDENTDGTGDGHITSTAGHAYWAADTPDGDGYWAPARDLATGAWLRTSSGTWIQTTTITTHTTQTHTYNLTIANHHTYYVTTGNTNALVHNCNSDIADLPIHEKPTRFYAKASEMEERFSSNPPSDQQMLGSSEVGHGGVSSLSNADLIRFGGPNGREPIAGYRDFAPGDDVNYPGSLLYITDGNNRTAEIARRVRDGLMRPDTLIEIMIGGR